MKVAVLGGTAGLGKSLALRFCASGFEVVIGSRVKERAEAVAEELSSSVASSRVSGALNSVAVVQAKFVFFAVPYSGLYEVARSVRNNLAEESIAVSTVVPLESDIGGSPRYLEPSAGSAAEALQQLLKSVPVVSAFNCVPADALADLNRELDVIVCGERQPSDELIGMLRRVRGTRPIYGGPLLNSRVTERLTQLLIEINRAYGVKDASVRIEGV
ncbi:MAG: NADPH-dependent F420 reductase [Thaumarchaeota archaeon]|nr:NADPH-dependent F420 reductase [Candidatus Calditenuaceae archaeon]MDW8187317.1 NADPH-dependent F420 reductase [Nitrososphaerota archaeon]